MHGADYVIMARKRAGLTQRELAERLGCRQATIARWEHADRGVGLDDIERVAHACGLQFEMHLLVEDRSWWPQIATQLELDPLQRVRRLTPPGAPDIAAALSELAAGAVAGVLIGDVAGALHGWPLVLTSPTIEICGSVAELNAHLQTLGAHQTRAARYILAGGVSIAIEETPPATRGAPDLSRGSIGFQTPRGPIQTAGLLDLLRIADASTTPRARRDSLALQAVLDVNRQPKVELPDQRAAEDRIAEWLGQQTPVK